MEASELARNIVSASFTRLALATILVSDLKASGETAGDVIGHYQSALRHVIRLELCEIIMKLMLRIQESESDPVLRYSLLISSIDDLASGSAEMAIKSANYAMNILQVYSEELTKK